MLITMYKEANQLQSSCISLNKCYCTCSYTMRVVWQTKCKFVMCIARVSCVFAIPHALTKKRVKQCMHKSFALVKRASICVYLRACVKVQLNCTVTRWSASVIKVCVVDVDIRMCIKPFVTGPAKIIHVSAKNNRFFVFTLS